MNQKLFSSITGKADRSSGIISNVSVATVGEAKGHEIRIDSTTLEQIKIAAERAESVQVKVDHWSGFDGIVGTLRAFRVEGDHLRADLHLLENHPARTRILEMAEKMPGNFGLSIAYVGVSEEKEGTAFARVTELLSVDLVDAPAANPSGLFASVTPDLVEMRRRHIAEMETHRAATHALEMQLLEKDATVSQLRREKEFLERRCHTLTHDVDLLVAQKAAEIASSFGTSVPANITPGKLENEFAHMRGVDLAKAANKERQP